MESQFVNKIIHTFKDDTHIQLEVWKKNQSAGTKLIVKYYALDCDQSRILFVISKEFYTYTQILDFEYSKLLLEIESILNKFVLDT